MLIAKLKINEKELAKKIRIALTQDVKKVLVKASVRITQKIKNRFRVLLFSHPTVNDLIGGRLKGELGVINPDMAVDNIINTWISGMVVEVMNVKISTRNYVHTGFRLSMIRKDWSDVIRLNTSSYYTDKGMSMNWLEWLLIRGSEVIVRDYDFALKVGTGRTGLGHMEKGFARKRWYVPPQHAGTTNDNFVTQVIDQLHLELPNIMKSELIRALK